MLPFLRSASGRLLLLLVLVSSIGGAVRAQESRAFDVRGIRCDDGNGVEVTSDALEKLDLGPADGVLSYTLYVSTAADAPFQPVPGSSNVLVRAKAAVETERTTGNRRSAKNKVVLVDASLPQWHDGEPWPEPRRYRVGETKAPGRVPGADERLSSPSAPRPIIMHGVDPDETRIQIDEIPKTGWLELGFSFSLEDQHYDIAGAGLTVTAGSWVGHLWSSRVEGKRAFMPEASAFSPDSIVVPVRIPAALGVIHVDVEAEGHGFSAKRSFTLVPTEQALKEPKENAAVFAQSYENAIEATRHDVEALGPRIAEMRERVAKEKDPAMKDEMERVREDIDTSQLEFASLSVILSEKHPHREAEAAERACDWGRSFAAVDRETTVTKQIGDLRLQRWGKDPERARLVSESNEQELLLVEARRAEAALKAGVPSAFRESCEARLKLLEGKRDLEQQGQTLVAMAHGIALLSGDRQAAADAFKRGRAALLEAAKGPDRDALAKSFEADPLPAWWPATAQPPPQAKTDADPYWDWEAGFLKLAREKLANVAGARLKVAHLSLAVATLRARRLRMTEALAAETAAEQYSDEMRARLKSQIEHDREAESGFFAPETERIEKEALDGLRTLSNEIEQARAKWGVYHPNLLTWGNRAGDLERRLPFELAEAASDAPRLGALLRDEANREPPPPETERWLRLVETKQALLSGDAIRALFILRDLRRADPANPEVRRRLTELEASFLRSGLAKAQGAIAAARADFDRYLTERGLGTGMRDTSWLSQAFSGLRDYDSETAWVVWSTGLLGALSGAVDAPGTEEEKLKRRETPLANASLGIQIMTRLAVRGFTLAEIRRMDAPAILEKLPPRTTAGKPWDRGDAAAFRRQIDAALDLTDVRMLVDDERDGLREALARDYWNPDDACSTWIEWVGDLSSPRNILSLWLPFLRIESAGQVVSGTQALARGIGLQAATEWAGGTKFGSRVAEILSTSAQYRGESLVWQAGQFVAYLGLQASAGCLAKQFAGQYGQIASEALFALAADPAALSSWMKEGKATRDAVAELLDAVDKAIAERLARLRELEATRAEVVAILREMEANPAMTLDPARDAKLKEFLGSDWLKSEPGFPVGGADDVVAELVQGIADARRKTASGVRKALEEAKETIDADLAVTLGREDAAKKVRSCLSPAIPVPPPKLEAFLPEAVERYVAKFGLRRPWVVKEGSRAAQAFGVLRAAKTKEELIAAGKAFRSLAKDVDLEQAPADLPAQILRWYADLAQDLASEPPRSLPSGVDEELTRFIDPKRVDEAVAKAQSASWTKRPVSETASVEAGGERFLVKRMTLEGGRLVEDLVRAAEGEVMEAGLCHALGVTAPAVGVRPRLDAKGSLEVYIVTRFVPDAEEVEKLSAAAVYRLNERLSFHRGIALLLDDYDRKLGNYLITKNGYFCVIDGASADVRGFVPGNDYHVSVAEPEFMEGAWGIGHWMRRCRNVFEIHGSGLPPEMRANLLAELALAQDPAREAVDKVKQLVAGHQDYVRNLLRTVHGIPEGASPGLTEAYKHFHADTGSVFDERDLDKIVANVIGSIQARIGRAEEALASLATRNGQR